MPTATPGSTPTPPVISGPGISAQQKLTSLREILVPMFEQSQYELLILRTIAHSATGAAKTKIEHEISELERRITELEALIQKLERELRSEGVVLDHSEELRRIRIEIESNTASITQVLTKVNGMTTDLANLATTLGQVESNIIGKINGVSSKLTELENQIKEIPEDIDEKIVDRINAMILPKLENLLTVQGELKSSFDAFKTTTDAGFVRQIERIEQAEQKLSEQIDENSDSIKKLIRARSSSISKGITNINQIITNNTTITSNFEVIIEELTAIRAELDAIKKKKASGRGSGSSTKRRVNRIMKAAQVLNVAISFGGNAIAGERNIIADYTQLTRNLDQLLISNLKTITEKKEKYSAIRLELLDVVRAVLERNLNKGSPDMDKISDFGLRLEKLRKCSRLKAKEFKTDVDKCATIAADMKKSNLFNKKVTEQLQATEDALKFIYASL